MRVVIAIMLGTTLATGGRHSGALPPQPHRANDATLVDHATSDDSTAIAALVRARRAASNASIARHDTAGIAAIFSAHVVVVSSASQVVHGRDLNARTFAEQFRMRPDVVYVRTPDDVTVFMPWAMASERGHWRGWWSTPDGRIEIGGSYFAKWRRVGAGWFVESETYVPEFCRGGAFCSTAPAIVPPRFSTTP
jgi:ketosteroid isomerase-like protein